MLREDFGPKRHFPVQVRIWIRLWVWVVVMVWVMYWIRLRIV